MKSFKEFLTENKKALQKYTDVDNPKDFKEVILSISDDERVTAMVMSQLDEFIYMGDLYVIDSTSDDCTSEFNHWVANEDIFDMLMKSDDNLVELSSTDFFAIREYNKQKFGWLYNTDSGEFIIICANDKGFKYN